jgi:hypothetical protein
MSNGPYKVVGLLKSPYRDADDSFLPQLARNQQLLENDDKEAGTEKEEEEEDVEHDYPIVSAASSSATALENPGGIEFTIGRSPHSTGGGIKPTIQIGESKPKPPNLAKMTSIIAAELNQLGQKGRKLAYEDVHGVTNETLSEEEASNPEEDIASHVATLLKETKRIRERSALDKAIFLAPRYVNDPDFCLMFLRAEHFHANLAARRLALHFKLKLELFGLEMLARDITFDDLNADDKLALFTGSEQYLGRDSSGRTILFSSIQLRSYKTIENQVSQEKCGCF